MLSFTVLIFSSQLSHRIKNVKTSFLEHLSLCTQAHADGQEQLDRCSRTSMSSDSISLDFSCSVLSTTRTEELFWFLSPAQEFNNIFKMCILIETAFVSHDQAVAHMNAHSSWY